MQLTTSQTQQWRGRADSNLPDVKNKLQAHTNNPVLPSAIASVGFESQPQPANGSQIIARAEVVPILMEERPPSLVLQKDHAD